MADPNPLDALLLPETDESVVNALVASLESRLASPTNKEHPSSISNPSVNSNHVSGIASNAACTSAQNTAQNNSVHLSNDTGNINNSSSKAVIKDTQILGINSIHAESAIARVNSPVNARRTASPKPPNSVNKPDTGIAQVVSRSQNHGNHTIVTNVVHSHMNSATPPPNATTVHHQNPGIVKQNVNAQVTSQIIAAQSDSVIGNRASSSPATLVNSHGQPAIIQASSSIGKNTQAVLINSNAQPITQKTNVHIVHSANITSAVSQPVSNPSVITVRGPTQMPAVRPQVVTSQVVNASSPRPQGNVRIQQNRMPNAPIRIASSQPIAPRPGGPASTITLPPGTIVPGQGAVLMKNEHGSFVIVHQPGSLAQQQPAQSSSVTISTSAQKVQYVRPPTTPQRLPSGQILTIQPGHTQPQTVVRQAIPSPVNTVRMQGQHGVRGVGAMAAAQAQGPIHTVVRTSTTQGIITTTGGGHSHTTTGTTHGAGSQGTTSMGQAAVQHQQMMENVKKCKNFLSTLIKLAASQPEATVSSVRDLIQGLIDGKLEPEVFTEKLQKELKSSPQPYLVPFLKKSLPLLRQSLLNNKMTIDGVRPPPIEVLQQHAAATTAPTRTSDSTTQPVYNRVGKPMPKNASMSHHGGGGHQKPAHITPATAMSHQQQLQHQQQQQQHHGGGKKPVLSKQVNMMGGNVPSTVKAFQSRVAGLAPSSSPGGAAGSSGSHGHKEKRKFEALNRDDDDINDVATMGGVNLSEESRNILATQAEYIGTQIRSCKDEAFLFHNPLLSRITAIASKHGISEVPTDVVNLISHGTQERLRHIVEKLSTIAEQRMEIYKINDKFESSTDVKSQLKFLEELDVLERKRHDEQEKEMLRRAAKSRSKHEDPEQAKLKQRAKDLQMAEMEEVRQREANITALAAIGPWKKRKIDTSDTPGSSTSGSSMTNGPASARQPLRPRIKRVNLRDLLFLMEQDRTINKSNLTYRTFLK